MQASPNNRSKQQDWRLEAKLDTSEVHGALERLIGGLHRSGALKTIDASVPNDVVITHDGKLLFAYAGDETTVKAARSAIESALQHDAIRATLLISHWDDALDRWRQVDPPIAAQAELIEAAANDAAEALETRTMIATAGRGIRAGFEQTMLTWAEKLGLRCKVFEHPHLLTTQVGFTVTGPKRKIDEFSEGLIAEGWSTIRGDAASMLSPL